MKKLYIIYNTITGRFKSMPLGIVDIDQSPDGSTLFEAIPSQVAKRPGHDVIYLDEQELPDPYQKKVVAGQLVDLDTSDIADDQAEDDKATAKANLVSRDVELFRMIIAIWDVGVAKGLWVDNDLPANIKTMAIDWKQKLQGIDS